MGRRASKSFNTRRREQKERMRKRREIQKLEREKEKAQDPKESLRKSLLLVPVKKKVKAQKKKIYIRKNIDRDYKPSTKIHVAILKRMFKMTRLRVEAKAKKEARANKTSKTSVFVKKRVKMTKSIQSKADNHTESRFKTVSDKNAPQPNKKRIETNIDKDYKPSTKMTKVNKKKVFKMTRTRLRKNNAHDRTIKTEKENENMITVTKMGTQTNPDQPSKKRLQTINDKEAMTSAKKRMVIRVSDDRSFRRTRTRMSTEIDNAVLNVPINNDQDTESVNENVETVDGMRMRKPPKRRMGPYIDKKQDKQKKRRMDKNFESMIKKIQEDIDAVSDVMAEQLTIENRNLLPTKASKDLDSEESTAPEQSQKKKRSIHIETSSVVKAKELETSSVVKTKKLKNKVQNKNASEGLRILRKQADKEQSSWIHGCGLCDKKYTDMDSLILHMKSHTSKDLDSEESTVPKQSQKKTSNLKKKRTHIETSSVVKVKGLKNKVQSNTCTGLNPSNRKYRDSESTANELEPHTEEQSLTIVIKKEPVETDDVSLLVFNPLEKNSNLNQQSQASSSNNSLSGRHNKEREYCQTLTMGTLDSSSGVYIDFAETEDENFIPENFIPTYLLDNNQVEKHLDSGNHNLMSEATPSSSSCLLMEGTSGLGQNTENQIIDDYHSNTRRPKNARKTKVRNSNSGCENFDISLNRKFKPCSISDMRKCFVKLDRIKKHLS